MLLCYAHGRGTHWEGLCVDLDIAVQGGSLAEIEAGLKAAISDYLESVEAEPDEAVRHKLFNRRAPLSVRLKMLWRILRTATSHRNTKGETTATQSP